MTVKAPARGAATKARAVGRRRVSSSRGGPEWESPVTRYALDVTAGRIVAGWRVRKQCERHLRDLERGHDRGLRFDAAEADYAIRFFPQVLRLAEGAFAGKPFELEAWQQFIVGSLFGWRRADGTRRFREAYVESGKGSGKSPMAAGIGLFGTVADGEAAAEVYVAATKLEQAKVTFRDVENMVAASPALARRLTKTTNNMADLATSSFIRAISSEKRGLDGPRVHMALLDEIHEHPDDVVVEKIKKGRKGRRQPLIFMITNAGYDRHSVCWHYHEYAEKVLQDLIADDEFFAYVCGLDPCDGCFSGGHMQPKDGCASCDDWRDERTWLKANPNLGVSITAEYLRSEVAQALAMPSRRNITLRLNFCVWTEQEALWIPIEKYRACRIPDEWEAYAERLAGRVCWGGLDLSSKTDLTALVLRFLEDDAGCVDTLEWFWAPAERVAQRSLRDGVPYDRWAEEGLLFVTPGEIIDYEAIERFIIDELQGRFAVQQLGFDPWNATDLATRLGKQGAPMVEVRQGYYSLSEASKAWEALIVSGRERHRGHELMEWMVANVTVELDPAGNIKPSKKRSRDRIDGPVARVIAESLAIRAGESDAGGISVYVSGEDA